MSLAWGDNSCEVGGFGSWTFDQARRALADGADGLVVQGLEAGGHLLAEEPLAEALPRVLSVASGKPVLAAGGIATAEDVRRVLDAGAAAAWCGTRFLLTDECGAHPEYKRRVLGAGRTVETRVFGFGWPDRHRVVPNAATERWEGRAVVPALNSLSRPLARVLPLSLAGRMAALARPGVPLLGPSAALAGMPDRVVDASPLYAGTCAARIDRIVPAAEAVRALAPA